MLSFIYHEGENYMRNVYYFSKSRMLVSCEFTMVHDELHPFSNHAEFNDVFTLSHEYAVLIDSHTIHVPLNS